MLHELLLVLYGHESDLFVPVEESSSSQQSQHNTTRSITYRRVQLAKDLPFLHESERSIIDRLCVLGSQSRFLKHYTRTHRLASPVLGNHDVGVGSSANSSNSDTGSGVMSMYKRSICVGIDEILEKYHETLLQVEQDLLEEYRQNSDCGSRGKAVLPLSYLVHMLRDYEVLLDELCNLVEVIESQGLKGGPLLDYVHRKSFSGAPLIRHTMKRILFHCNVVMIRHITAWMVFGRLVDRFNEFFIEDVGAEGDAQMKQHSDAMEVDSPGSELGMHGHGHAAHYGWKQRYRLRMAMIPNYINLHLANKILFVGKAIKVLQQPDVAESASISSKKIAIISRSELHQFSDALQVHERTPALHISSFEFTVDRVRDAVARHLWNLIVVESNLAGHLSLLKDFFLLSKGDLFQCFIEDSQQLMSIPPHKNAEQDIRMIFQRSIRKLQDDNNGIPSNDGEDDNNSEQELHRDFILTLEKNGKRITSTPADALGSARGMSGNLSMISSISSSTHSSENAKHEIFDAWCQLSLQYEAKWPLHLLFDQSVIDRYNMLFRFLFVVKRVQVGLQKAWTPLVKYRASSPAMLKPLLMLRSRMGFFIDNLQFYLHVDVIAVQFKMLMDSIVESKDFETVKRAHDNFLNTLIVQCFLSNSNKGQVQQQQQQQISTFGRNEGHRSEASQDASFTTVSSSTTSGGGSASLRQQIMTQLELIFRHCMTLTYIVEKEESRKLRPDSQKQPFESDELKFRTAKLAREFDFELSCLFKILSAAKYPHLQQLMLRIDYNKYLSTGGKPFAL